MRIPGKLAFVAVVGLAGAMLGALPAQAATVEANSTFSAVPFCPEKAPFMGTYQFSFVGTNGHHYDIYFGPPLSPFGHAIIDCDA